MNARRMFHCLQAGDDKEFSVDVIIVRDKKVILLQESSKSFAYGGAYHQPWKMILLFKSHIIRSIRWD